MAKSDRRMLGEHDEMLPVKLTKEEVLERSQKIGDTHAELAEHQEAAAFQKAKLKAKEDELQGEVDRLAHILRTREEPRKVRVEAWANFVKNRFEAVRTDTGATIYDRPLKPEERQGEFDLEGWSKQLALTLMSREQEDIAKKRAGDGEKEEERG